LWKSIVKKLLLVPVAFVQGGIDLAVRIVGQLWDFDAVQEELSDLRILQFRR
jgi:hypothetical protein